LADPFNAFATISDSIFFNPSSGDGIAFMLFLSNERKARNMHWAAYLGCLGEGSKGWNPEALYFGTYKWILNANSAGKTFDKLIEDFKKERNRDSKALRTNRFTVGSWPVQLLAHVGDALDGVLGIIGNDGSTMLSMADACAHGFGACVNPEQAVEWTKEEVDAGNDTRRLEVAEAYFWGSCAPLDLEKATHYAKGTGSALEQALAEGKSRENYPLQRTESLQHLEKLAEGLPDEAVTKEYHMYLSAYLHTEKGMTDMVYRRRLLETAKTALQQAGCDVAPILPRLHRLYLYSREEGNLARFAAMAQEESEKGNPRYVEVAALAYLRGIFGFPVDIKKSREATEWLIEHSQEVGYRHWIPVAYVCCAYSETPDYEKAVRYLEKFEDKGAYFLLSHMYRYGWGVKHDWNKSMELLEKAADGSENEADLLLFREKLLRW